MSGSLSLLTLTLKSILKTRPWEDDVETLSMPWQEESFAAVSRRKINSQHLSKGKLVFGVMRDDGSVKPDSSIQSALTRTVDALDKSGYEVSCLSMRLSTVCRYRKSRR